MPRIQYKDISFVKYSGGCLPGYFEYDEQDTDLAQFYNEDAQSMQSESMVSVMDVFHNEKLVGYFAYLPSSLKFSQIKYVFAGFRSA